MGLEQERLVLEVLIAHADTLGGERERSLKRYVLVCIRSFSILLRVANAIGAGNIPSLRLGSRKLL